MNVLENTDRTSDTNKNKLFRNLFSLKKKEMLKLQLKVQSSRTMFQKKESKGLIQSKIIIYKD